MYPQRYFGPPCPHYPERFKTEAAHVARKEIMVRWRERNPEGRKRYRVKTNAYQKAYRRRHRDRLNAAARRRRAKNLSYENHMQRLRYALGIGITKVPKEIRDIVVLTDELRKEIRNATRY